MLRVAYSPRDFRQAIEAIPLDLSPEELKSALREAFEKLSIDSKCQRRLRIPQDWLAGFERGLDDYTMLDMYCEEHPKEFEGMSDVERGKIINDEQIGF